MERSVRLSTMLLAATLSPALLQPISCDSGNPTLTSLELQVLGQNQLANFNGGVLSYSISSPAET